MFTNYIYHIYLLRVVFTGSAIVNMLKLILVPIAYYHIYTNLPVNAIVRLPHPRNGDSQGQEMFLAPSADVYYIYILHIYILHNIYIYIYIYCVIYIYVIDILRFAAL